MDVVGNAGHMFSLSKSFCMDCSEMLLAPRASRGIHGTGLVLRMSGSLPSANVGTAVSTAGMRRRACDGRWHPGRRLVPAPRRRAAPGSQVHHAYPEYPSGIGPNLDYSTAMSLWFTVHGIEASYQPPTWKAAA